ncbi:MAG: hypothetical protein AMS17_15040 [Spirochaetes bacterium DG_61]|nr:MAG: hypothetical protein AMS17_15040 [Spirochaetes bacterium DG_61]
MEPEDIIHYYPCLYHMAESGSWPSIKRHGLLSTSALLDLFEIHGKKRFKIESRQRRESVTIHHPVHGSAVIRDQKPLNEGALQKLIDGMSTREYYELLNRKIFFWARKIRLERLLHARAYREKSHTVLTVDTRDLLDRYQNEVWLSHINSGAIFGSGRRGVGTFKRINDYPFEEMRKKKKEDAIVEVAVDYAVKDISKLIIRVEEWKGQNPVRIIC